MVSKITWTGEIGTTEYQEFEVSGRPPARGRRPDHVPRPSRPTPAARWAMDRRARRGGRGGARAPRALLELVDPEEEGAAGGGDDAGDGNEGEAASGLTVENAASQDDVDSANTLATVGVAVGVIGLLVAVFADQRAPANELSGRGIPGRPRVDARWPALCRRHRLPPPGRWRRPGQPPASATSGVLPDPPLAATAARFDLFDIGAPGPRLAPTGHGARPGVDGRAPSAWPGRRAR